MPADRFQKSAQQFFDAIFRHATKGELAVKRFGAGMQPKGNRRASVQDRRGAIHMLAATSVWAADQPEGMALAYPALFNAASKTDGEDAVIGSPALVVDIDKGDTVASLGKLTSILGRPTLLVYSGGDVEPGTPKMHAYWRLSKVAETPQELANAKMARAIMVHMADGDRTGIPLAHGFRTPGSLNRKPKYQLPDGSYPSAKIVSYEPALEVDLDQALLDLQDACPEGAIAAKRTVSEAADGTALRFTKGYVPVPEDELFRVAKLLPCEGFHYGSKDESDDGIELETVGIVQMAAAFYDAAAGEAYGREAFGEWYSRLDATSSTYGQYSEEEWYDKGGTLNRIAGRPLLRYLASRMQPGFMFSDEVKAALSLVDIIEDSDGVSLEDERERLEAIFAAIVADIAAGKGRKDAIQTAVGVGKSTLMHRILPAAIRAQGHSRAVLATITAREHKNTCTMPKKKLASERYRLFRYRCSEIKRLLASGLPIAINGYVASIQHSEPLTPNTLFAYLVKWAETLPEENRPIWPEDIDESYPQRNLRPRIREYMRAIRNELRAVRDQALREHREVLVRFREAKSRRGQLVLAYPDHERAAEAVEELRHNFKDEFQIVHYKGRQVKDMCVVADVVQMAIEAGDNISRTMCGNPKTGIVCPFYQRCPYIAQKSQVKQADILVTTHALVYAGLPAEVDPYMVVFDEDPIKGAFDETATPFTHDQYYNSISSQINTYDQMLKAVQKPEYKGEANPDEIRTKLDDLKWLRKKMTALMRNAADGIEEIEYGDDQIPRIFARREWFPGDNEELNRAIAIEASRVKGTQTNPQTPLPERKAVLAEVRPHAEVNRQALKLLRGMLDASQGYVFAGLAENWCSYDLADGWPGPKMFSAHHKISATQAEAMGLDIPASKMGSYLPISELATPKSMFAGIHLTGIRKLDPKTENVLILSATAHPKLTKVLFPTMKFHAGRKIKMGNVQIYSQHPLRLKRGSRTAYDDTRAILKYALDICKEHGADPRQCGAILPMAYEKIFKEAGFITMHYNATAGKNAMTGVTDLFVIGGPALPPEVSLRRSAIVFRDEGIDPRNVRASEPNRKLMHTHTVLGEFIQAVGRGRLHSRGHENPLRVHDMTSVYDDGTHVSLPVDGLMPVDPESLTEPDDAARIAEHLEMYGLDGIG